MRQLAFKFFLILSTYTSRSKKYTIYCVSNEILKATSIQNIWYMLLILKLLFSNHYLVVETKSRFFFSQMMRCRPQRHRPQSLILSTLTTSKKIYTIYCVKNSKFSNVFIQNIWYILLILKLFSPCDQFFRPSF